MRHQTIGLGDVGLGPGAISQRQVTLCSSEQRLWELPRPTAHQHKRMWLSSSERASERYLGLGNNDLVEEADGLGVVSELRVASSHASVRWEMLRHDQRALAVVRESTIGSALRFVQLGAAAPAAYVGGIELDRELVLGERSLGIASLCLEHGGREMSLGR